MLQSSRSYVDLKSQTESCDLLICNLSGSGHEISQNELHSECRIQFVQNESKKKAASVNQSLKKEQVWKKTMEKSFWKKIKSRYDNANKKKENTNIVDRIVVLKPSHRVVECPVDIGCRCLHLHPHRNSASKQHIVKHTRVSFNDVRKKLKSSKKLKSFRKMKSFSETDESGSKTECLSLVPYSKHQEPEVFMEARRHLAERLRLVAMGAGLGEPSGSSCKQVSRTLERILLLSPGHESMAAFECEPEGTHGEKSLQKTWNGSDPNSIGPSPSGTDGCIEGQKLELLLDVSSPKAGCKSETMDTDQFRENPSPVSVLDSFFSDNISSPTSTIESVELQIQPRRLDFEEQFSQTSSPLRETSLSLFAEDRGFISSYVNEIYQTAQSNWEDFLATDYPLEPSCAHKVLYDYVKEVLVSLHSKITVFSSRVQPFSLEKDVINKVIDQVDWHNGQPMGPRTLDHLVRRDMAKCGPWLDTLSDRDDIVVEVADEILLELVIEVILDIYF
ncbi:hypothetical protein L1987_05065 [Smallanthus sonchifolius]|uniref:Uncharacterized protein n=1 Tax=Smallanthus sonchifolius TaxID=185202 RepID=A0ACB9JUH8_9ASTR|nr:hypothetical protein L1987_05065 [Smallanthus sonchifolius]